MALGRRALRYLPRLGRGDPDDLFRQDHILERGPGGTPGLERGCAAGMPADAAPTAVADIDATTRPPYDCDCFDAKASAARRFRSGDSHHRTSARYRLPCVR